MCEDWGEFSATFLMERVGQKKFIVTVAGMEHRNVLSRCVSNMKPNENVSPCVEGGDRCRNSKSRIITLMGSTPNTYHLSTPRFPRTILASHSPKISVVLCDCCRHLLHLGFHFLRVPKKFSSDEVWGGSAKLNSMNFKSSNCCWNKKSSKNRKSDFIFSFVQTELKRQSVTRK